MGKTIRTLTKSLFLFIIVITIVFIGYFGFISGPIRVYEQDDLNYIQTLRNYDKYESSILTLMNRFAFDQVYYIVDVSENDVHDIVWFSKDHSILDSTAYKDMDQTQLTQYNMSNGNMDYGVYKEKLVYVLKEGNHEIYLDYETLEPVFEVGRLNYVVE